MQANPSTSGTLHMKEDFKREQAGEAREKGEEQEGKKLKGSQQKPRIL